MLGRKNGLTWKTATPTTSSRQARSFRNTRRRASIGVAFWGQPPYFCLKALYYATKKGQKWAILPPLLFLTSYLNSLLRVQFLMWGNCKNTHFIYAQMIRRPYPNETTHHTILIARTRYYTSTAAVLDSTGTSIVLVQSEKVTPL